MFNFTAQIENRNWQKNCQNDIVRFEEKHDRRFTLNASAKV